MGNQWGPTKKLSQRYYADATYARLGQKMRKNKMQSLPLISEFPIRVSPSML